MGNRLMERLERLAEMITKVVEKKREEKRNQHYSPLVVSHQIQQDDPEETFVPKNEKENAAKP